MRQLCLLVIVLLPALNHHSIAQQDCATHATPLQHTFDSGAQWTLCWHIDEQFGLTLSNLAYATPQNPPREIFAELHLAGILLHYDDTAQASELLSEYGMAGSNQLPLSALNCLGDIISDTESQPQLCLSLSYKNTLTRYASADILPRRKLSLIFPTKIGSLIWTHTIELTEDGVIEPAISLSGRINRFDYNVESSNSSSANEVRTGRFASSATILGVWRMDANIDGTPDNDVIEQIQFDPDGSLGVRRRISVEPITTASFHQVAASRFRGWRVRDTDLSAADGGSKLTRVGYFLDPQSVNYRYTSQRLNWARHDFFVTENSTCEKLVNGNRQRYPHCANTLDEFISNAGSASVRDPVMWFSLSSRFVPNSGDWPVISTRRSSFKLIPFDWSAQSPFASQQPVFADTQHGHGDPE